jgi:hypothetical protein
MILYTCMLRGGWGGVARTEDEDGAGGDGGRAPGVEGSLGDEGLVDGGAVDEHLALPHLYRVPSHRHCRAGASVSAGESARAPEPPGWG